MTENPDRAVLDEFGCRSNDCDHTRYSCEEVGCDLHAMKKMAAEIVRLRADTRRLAELQKALSSVLTRLRDGLPPFTEGEE